MAVTKHPRLTEKNKLLARPWASKEGEFTPEETKEMERYYVLHDQLQEENRKLVKGAQVWFIWKRERILQGKVCSLGRGRKEWGLDMVWIQSGEMKYKVWLSEVEAL